jgi:nascent polypeptide-associated complex subunit alpha
MIPGMNPKAMKQAMKKLGLKQEEIEANEVIIKCEDREIVIKNPQVVKMNMMGQDSIQITGDIIERDAEVFNEDDIKTIMEQTGCDEETAKELLQREGDIAAAILAFERKKE